MSPTTFNTKHYDVRALCEEQSCSRARQRRSAAAACRVLRREPGVGCRAPGAGAWPPGPGRLAPGPRAPGPRAPDAAPPALAAASMSSPLLYCQVELNLVFIKFSNFCVCFIFICKWCLFKITSCYETSKYISVPSSTFD